LPNVCPCGHPYCKASYRFGFEIWSYSQFGYNLDENQFLDMCVIQSACNVFIYPAIIYYNSSFVARKKHFLVVVEINRKVICIFSGFHLASKETCNFLKCYCEPQKKNHYFEIITFMNFLHDLNQSCTNQRKTF
jgi:hypothetical protein